MVSKIGFSWPETAPGVTGSYSALVEVNDALQAVYEVGVRITKEMGCVTP